MDINFLSVAAVGAVRTITAIMALFGLIGGTAAIAAGVYMVYIGSSGTSVIDLFGQKISTTNVGVACVFLGIVAIVVVIRRAFGTLDKAIAAPREND